MIVIITVLFGMFCAAMEALITATILPSIITDLGGLDYYPWIINGFLLSFIVTAPVFGKLSDSYGYKQVYLIAVSVFLISSTLCGMAQSMEQLIVFRSLQGIGTGGLITMSIIFFGEIFPLDQRPKMQAMLSAMWAIASLLGPAIGAYLTISFSWRWAFLINLPLASLIFISILVFAPSKPADDQTPGFDYKGLILFMSGCFCLVYGLIELSQFHSTVTAWISLISGLWILTLFFRHSKTHIHSFIPFKLFERREVLLAITLGFCVGVFLFCTANFLPMYVQGVLRESAKEAGKVVTAIALGSFTGSLLSGLLLNRLGFRPMTISGALSILFGFVFLLANREAPEMWSVILGCYPIGLGISLIANASIITLQAASPKEMLGRATSLFHFCRSFGGLIGIAVMGGIQLGILKEGLDGHPLSETPQLLFDPVYRSHLSKAFEATASSALATSIHSIFAGCLILALFTLVIARKVTKKRPIDYTSHKDSHHV